MTTLTIYSKTDCPHCDTARAYLTGAGIPFTEIKHDDPADRQALYDRLGLVGPARTVPQCVVSADGEDWLIGGARELMMSGVGSLFVGKRPESVPQTRKSRLLSMRMVPRGGTIKWLISAILGQK